jgi:hypothetical protein
MEDVLAVYARTYDEAYPVVCVWTRNPINYLPCTGAVTGTAGAYRSSIFIVTEPLADWRYVQVLPRRTKQDWMKQIKWLLDTRYSEAQNVILVMDNLNTHTLLSLYETFSPSEAFRLDKKLELHLTLKYGSWLTIAELELSALTAQCLGDRRIGAINRLNTELSAWHTQRNRNQKRVDWQFTMGDVQTKLKRLYPKLSSNVLVVTRH